MTLFRKLGPAKGAAAFAGAAWIVWAVCACVFFALPPAHVLAFGAFLLLAVISPGLALTKLLRLRLRPLESLCTGYGLGLALLLAVYFVFAPLRAMGGVRWAVAALAVLGVWLNFRLRRQPLSGEADSGELRLALWLCAFAALATAVTFSAGMLEPSLTGPRAYFYDATNGIALTTAASRGFPMLILQMSGTEHWYHIGFFAYAAVMKLCLGFSSFEIVTKYALLSVAPLLPATLVCLGRRAGLSNRQTLLGAVFTVFLGGGMVHYYYQDTIGYAMGIGCGVLAAALFLAAQQRAQGKNLSRLHIVSAALLLVSLAAKGPLAVSFLFGICFALLMQLFREKKWTPVLLRGLLYAVPFVAVYVLLFRGGASDSMALRLLWDRFTPQSLLPAFLLRLPESLQQLAMIVAYSILRCRQAAACFALLLVYRVYCWAAKRRPSALFDLTFGGSLLGFAFLNMFWQMGSSEEYFLYAMLPLLFLCSVECGAGLLAACRKPALRLLPAALLLALFALPAVQAVRDSAVAYYDDQANFDAGLHAAVRFSRWSPWQEITPDFRRKTTSVAEYEALVWLRDNTPADAVVVDGRYRFNNKFFDGTTFSERAFYLEGWGFVTMEDSNGNTQEKQRREAYLNALFESGDEGMLAVLAREGCSYLLLSDYTRGALTLTGRYTQEVFSNGEVTVYRILGAAG